MEMMLFFPARRSLDMDHSGFPLRCITEHCCWGHRSVVQVGYETAGTGKAKYCA